jgi:hypothetical protein
LRFHPIAYFLAERFNLCGNVFQRRIHEVNL